MSRPAKKKPVRGALSVRTFHEEAELGQTYDWRLLKRLMPYARPHMKLLIFALIMMPLTAGASLLQPYLLKLAVDAVLVERSSSALLTVVGLFAATLVWEFVARFGQIYTMQLAGQRTMADLRRHVFRHIQRLRVGYFDKTPIGRVVT